MASLREPSYTTSKVKTRQIGQVVDEMMKSAEGTRKGHERRWYDNNYFDDGYHFRYVSRQENKIVDWAEKTSIYNPLRAIPKASRQLRGMINLLISNELVPVIYPENVNKAAFPPQQQADPQTGQVSMVNPEYDKAVKEAARIAKNSGHWIIEEFKNQEIKEKLALMGLLSGKHSISYIKIWPDAVDEKIRSEVRDAFDVFTIGSLNELEDVPFIIEATPRIIAKIKADERFDEEQLSKIHPDNRHASSEIKEAYMMSRYGGQPKSDQAATLIQKEAFIKEYLNEDNREVIRKQEDGGEILEKRKMGDPVMRHVFVAGNIWLRDEYLDLTSYPYVDFRFEPGPLYQVPIIERFIPTNKSLDMVVSRIERYAHTMGVGIWQKRKGEDFNISNKAGGQIVSYKNIPFQQMRLEGLPPMFFNFIDMLNSFIEEQGVTTTTLGKIPAGVKSGKAIESLKESEYANLVIANQRLKQTVKRIAQKFMDIADNYFTEPQSYFYLEKGEPQYFDVIGSTALKKRNDVGLQTPQDVVPLSKDYNIEIEVQSGLGYTREGKKEAARELGDYIIQLAQLGVVPPTLLTTYLDKLFETYQFGIGNEVIKDMESFAEQGQLTDTQVEAVKVAVAEVMKDLELAGPAAEEREIMTSKIGAVEALKDTGVIEKDNSGGLEEEKVRHEMKLKEEKHMQDMVSSDEKQEITKAKALQDMKLKEKVAEESLKIKRETAKAKAKEKKKEDK